DHQWRTRKTPARKLGTGIVGRVAFPHHCSACCVECVHDSSRPKRIQASVVKRGRAARTGPPIGLVESSVIGVSPHGLARGRAIAGDQFEIAALLLCIDEIIGYGEGRPARSGWTTRHIV